MKEYLGNYDDYFEKVRREQEPDGIQPAGMTRTALDRERRKTREEKRRIQETRERMKKLEEEIIRAEEETGRMETLLADPETWRDPDRGAALNREYLAGKQHIEDLYEALAELEEMDTPV